MEEKKGSPNMYSELLDVFKQTIFGCFEILMSSGIQICLQKIPILALLESPSLKYGCLRNTFVYYY